MRLTARFLAQAEKGIKAVGSQKSFAELFRESKFVKMGDFNDRLVVGKIIHRMGRDVYVDFGSKFNAVCKTPNKAAERYVIGAEVVLRVYDTELSERFLGSKHDLTLLEADADIVGLYDHKRRAKPIAPKESSDFPAAADSEPPGDSKVEAERTAGP